MKDERRSRKSEKERERERERDYHSLGSFILRGGCVGDYESTLFSVTPGLHTKPDLIYVSNICLG